MKSFWNLLSALIISMLAFSASAQETVPVVANAPLVALDGVDFQVTAPAPAGTNAANCMANGTVAPARLAGGQALCDFTIEERGDYEVSIARTDGTVFARATVPVIWGWWSIAPAFIAILLALVIRQVLPALFIGVWVGAWLLENGGISGIGTGLFSVLDTYILRALVPEDGSTDHMSIILFTLLTGAMIGVISKNGGMGGIVNYITRYADTPKKGQLATSGLGLAVFFDDYANTLIVGNTMRPLLDKLRVSREKLAYLVDSTSAPLAATALITTWIGFQVSIIKGTLPQLDGVEMGAYEFMLAILPYSFYPFLALAFVFMVVMTGRDFGPMLKAERASRAMQLGGEPEMVHTKPNVKHEGDDLVITRDMVEGNIWNAAIPIGVLIFTTVAGLFATGEGETLSDIFGTANAFQAMMWASLLSLVVAVGLSVFTNALSLSKTMAAVEEGLAPMMAAAIILTFAWAIAAVNEQLHTADFVISVLGDGLTPQLIPAIVFVVAALTAFATGASWGTMAILIPLVLPLTWTTLQAHDMATAEFMPILYAAAASVLAGAVWGDHCSPISDTTILSSLASRCEHIAHVRTQMPYALLVGGVGLLTSIIPVSYGLPWWLGLLLSGALLYFILKRFGKEA